MMHEYEARYRADERLRRRLWIALWVAAIASYAAFTAAMIGPSFSHDALPTAAKPQGWSYDAICCQGNAIDGDCQAVSSKAVKPITGGYEITLGVGDHRLVTKRHSYTIGQARTRESPDGLYHVCLYPTEDNLQCFYAPPMGF